ncbi:isopeptide-forming domain-containing fimbrial protein [Streptococcus suis]|uniref:isopeptide-forming domain-containing fimbrial protein n=2 Tax=Streptococcus suis TaxID=1307 RepID=UPI003B9F126F
MKKYRRLRHLFMMFSVLLSQLGMLITSVPNIQAADLGSTTTDGVTTTVSQKGCAIKIETKQEVNWGLPRQPIDLVILQDASGSFTNTIRNVKDALIDLTTPVAADQYDEKNPRLVFTDDPKTTDRVMVASYGGADGYRLFDAADSNNVATSDSNFTTLGRTVAQNGYRFTSTGGSLLSSKQQIDNYINGFTVGGLTPTVPAIDQILAQYNTAKLQGGGMANNRKTVFLLITDGVANVHDVNGTKYLDLSVYRMQHLVSMLRSGRTDYDALYNYAGYLGYTFLGEFGQNYIARANELKEAGNRIKQSVGADGTVVVGFWEDQSQFVTSGAYWDTYLNRDVFARAGINTGDDRSVREVFEEALKSVSSPDKEINGENVSFYVNEQNDINAFSTKILKAVTSALTKENIVGDFTVTDGYKVNSVTINGKKVVETVTNENTEIKGTVTQEGTKVTISVPDSVFNPGKNSFEYDLTKTAAEDAALSEDEETDPADGYQPETKTETVGQLTGRFKVGDYVSDEIGSKDPTTVQVTDLKYCYPSATKSITDKDQSNDTGQLDDPVVKGKKSYAANLSTFSEDFTYQVLYRMNNAPLNFEANPMLIDKLDYRLEYVDAYVTGQDGQRLNNFNIRTTTGNDALGNQRTIVVADIPEAPGTQTQYVNEGKYGAHKFKQYTLHVKVRIKEQYSNANNPVVYRQILQENDGLGILNQANIVWNGKTNNPEDEEAKTRRSNTVYVKPPVETDIKKDVQSVPNKETGYKPGNSQEYLENRTQEFYYNVESSWPGLFDTYSISDTLVPELEVISAEVFINDVQNATLTNKLTIDANKQSVALNLVKADITNALNIQIRRATNNYTQPAVVRIGIKAKIRDNANLAKYVVNGEIKVPNEAQVVLNGKPQNSNIVYVTPKEPGISKKINDSKDEHNVLQESEDFTFDIKTKLPDNISAYKSYKIVDVLDERLELKDGAQPFVNAELSQHFDVSYDAATRTVTAAIKPGSFALLSGGETVHLTIPAKVKSGTAFAQIPNEAKVYYRDPSSTGEKETPPTPPVIVTPPPLIEKQVNGKQHADLTKRDEVFEYTIKSTVPKGADTFEITDELDEALEFAGNQGDVVVKIADTVVTDAVEVSAVGRNLGIKFTKEQLTNDAGKPIVVTFNAKIRGDANLSADKYVQTGTTLIPNTAKYILNNNPKESNEVTVTPPTPPTPTVDKKVNGQAHENLTNRDQTFEYSISTQVPTDAKKFEITDELKEVLEFAGADGKGEVVVKIGDKDVTQETTVKTENQNLTINLTSDQLSKLQGQAVVVTFKAKIRANVNLSDYITDGAVKVPNVANITVDNKPKVTSEPVTVTPPTPTDPTVDKLVNNQVHADLPQRDEVFEYTINTQVPTDAKSFEITDELKDVLEFAGADGKGDVVVKIGDKDVTKESTVTVAGQQLSVQLSATHLKDDAGKAVVVTFKSKIRANVNLTGYLEEGSNTIKIPNTASISVDHKPKVDSKPVTVTPPTPNNPTIVKEVNKKQHEDLTNREDVFEYTIQTQVPTDAKSFEITDELVEVLEFAGAEGKGDVVVTIGDTTVTDAVTIATSGQNLSVKLSPEQLQKDSGKAVVVTFKAKIRANANLSGYLNADDNTTKIPNTASFTIDNKPKENSNPVTVTPPTPPTPTVDKKVNGQAHENLTNRDQTFEYSISTQVPTDAKKFEITDELKDVLEFAGADGKGEVVVKIGDKDVTQETTVKTENQNLTINLTSDQLSKLQGQAVVVTFKAKIRANVNLSDYITDGAVKVPNVANITVDNKPKVTSEPVTVTPPTPTDPTVDKLVNNQVHADLPQRDEVFEYTINTQVPTDAKSFEITDELKDVLEFAGADGKGDVVVKIGDKDVTKESTVTVAGQQLSVQLSATHLKDDAGKAVVVTFKSKIRANVNLTGYLEEGSNTIKIPNTASISVDHKPKVDSKPVTVTPPTPNNPTIVKEVNKKQHEDLTNREDVFEYTIQTQVPTDAKSFEITDELVEVLEFAGAEGKGDVVVTIGDTTVTDAVTIATSGQNLSVKLSPEQLQKDSGKAVVVTFKAKIRANANLSGYLNADDNTTKIPNTASFTIDNKPKENSNPVTVTPPTPPTPTVDKKVNGQAHENLTNRDQTFEYSISTQVPTDAKKFEITDELKEVLEFAGADGKGEVVVKIGDKDVTQETTVKTENQNLTINLTSDQLSKLQGQAVVVTFKAKIRANVNLSDYITDGAVKVPNVANITVDNKPKVTSEPVTVTPPTPTDPTVDKLVNNQVHADLPQRDEVFEYTINTQVPTDAKSFEITDELKDVLEFAGADGKGDVVVKIGDKDVTKESTVTVAGQQLSVQLSATHLKDDAGKAVVVTFKSKIRANVNLTGYLEEGSNTIKIPNTASISVDHKPKVDSKPVTVTPPTPNNPTIVKEVNKKQHEDLTNREDVFEYTIQTQVPTDAKSFEITDELVEVLEFAGAEGKGDVVVTIGDTTVTDAVTIATSGQNLSVKLSPEQLQKDSGKAVVVTFKAKIRANANLSGYLNADDNTTKIPNTASFTIDNKPKENSNPVTVTPPTPPTPTVDKKVNGKAHENLTNRDQTFEYSISTQVPTDAKKFEITDELKDVLEFAGADGKGEVVVKIGDKDVTQETTVKTENQNLTINLTSDQLSKLQGQAVVVTFKAKIRANVNLSDYITDGAVKVPNVANITVDNKPKVTSEPVTVTPPSPENPPIVKDVNGADRADLATREESFTYHITSAVPTDATAFEISDTLVDVLEFDGEKGGATVTIDGKDASADATIAVQDQRLTVTLSEAQVKANGGKEVVVTFKAKIRPGANLSAYKVDGKTEIPNTAEYVINNNPETKKKSNEVPVTPPSPENPPIVKDVNGADRADLATREESFTYHITSAVPTDATAFEISDTLVDVLEFDGEKGGATVTIDGKDASADATIAVQDQRLTVTLSEAQVKANGGKEVVVTFKAKIRPGANLSAYKVDGKTEIPNTAEYVINNNPETKKKSNEVPVTPPSPENPPIVKDVNGADRADLATREESFTYHITSAVPTDATAFEISDTLVDVLEFDGEKGGATVTIDGKDASADATIAVQDQRLTVTLSEAQVKANGGKEVVVTFKAKIRPGANLSAYKVDGKTEIPNTAEYVINNNPETKKKSNEVPVTPPSPENPPIVKDVNGADRADLATREESFTYHITSAVPTDATAFEISDTLVDVLEFDGEKGGATVTIDGKDASADATIAVQDQRLTVTLSEAQVKANGGKEVVVTFKAKIRPGANLSAYKVDGKTEIPNTAEYVINNNPETKKKSNEVPVTPPSPENPPIVKDVNGADRADLATREESFTYHITSAVPTDATAFEISDTLVDVLEFDGEKGGATVTIDGKDASADATIAVQDQRLTVTLSEAQVKANGGKEVVVSFTAKIRPGANLSAYKVDGKTEIPNTAEYVINNNPETKKKSNEVPVTPPSPENPPIVKDVNGKESDTLANRYDVFTYHISTSVPNDATAFTITDTLVPVLEFSGDIAVEIDGKLISANTTIDNQTLTVDLTEEQVRNNGGKPVVVTFNAKIRSGANLSAYIVDGKTAVPNTAEYVINNNPETKKKSNEVPVYPPTPEGGEPEIDKKINKTLDYLEIARGKSYNYDITTTIPEDIVDYKEFVITDQVDSALQINGDVVVDIDGYSAEGIVDVVVDGQAVTVAVKDFSKLEGRSAIHIFIPATIRPEADLSTYVDNSVPNTANLHFTNGPGVTKDKSTVPVIVTPPTPPTPVPPTPGDPTKTVNTADGNEQAFHLDLLQRTSDFRYDIAYTIEADSQYTAFTMEDTLESVLNIQRVAIKVGSGENLVLKEFAELEAKLAEAKATLETLEAKKTEITNTVSSVATMATELEAQKVRIAEIEQELAIKEAELATASTASTTTPSTTEETDGTSVVDENTDNSQPVVDKQAEIQALTVAIEQLKASKDQVQQTVVELEQQIEVANTSEASLAALEVEIRNATASIEELEKQLAEKAPKATVAREVEAALLAVNEKGELTDASAAILGQVSIDKATNHVVFDITNPDVLASLRGRQVTMSIYATINPEADLSNYVTDKGIELVPNTASVTFDRNPQTKKKTNTVTVTPPPLPEPPGPPTPLPPLPPVEPPVPSDPPTQPTPPTPPTTPPAESTPPTPGKTLPKTGVAENGMYALVGMILGTLTLVFRRRKQ